MEFNNGSFYEYRGVPTTVFQGLLGAYSHGRYLNRWIKGRFRYSKIS